MIPPDTILHAHRKILVETLNAPTQTPTSHLPPPPAYTPSSSAPHPLSSETLIALTDLPPSSDDDEDDYPPLPPPINIKIDAGMKIVGHGNVLVSSPTEMATRLAGMVVGALRGAKVLDCDGGARMRAVEISVSGGVSVVGCRNVVGAAGVRAKGKGGEEGKEGAGEEGEGEGGRKRKAEAEAESVEIPPTKKLNAGGGD
ncbi:MAG: hypothetical protein M1830_008026 [Pleopsidium flavum]|nr:MAG: hypothetical protein M1830_008026 [Pleopsidium flavum]